METGAEEVLGQTNSGAVIFDIPESVIDGEDSTEGPAMQEASAKEAEADTVWETIDLS